MPNYIKGFTSQRIPVVANPVLNALLSATCPEVVRQYGKVASAVHASTPPHLHVPASQ